LLFIALIIQQASKYISIYSCNVIHWYTQLGVFIACNTNSVFYLPYYKAAGVMLNFCRVCISIEGNAPLESSALVLNNVCQSCIKLSCRVLVTVSKTLNWESMQN
jgi:hypothetical protein